MENLITPSILNSDLANVAGEVARIPSADWLHLDVMDGHFVPNLTFGLPVVEALAKHTTKPFDMHLMIDNPDVWAPQYAEAGCHSVTFHVEATHAPIRLARTLRKLGAKAAIGLNPTTGIEDYAPMLGEVDSVLIMTIEPGFGGQSFMDFTLPKIRRTRELIGDREIRIQVDGGVSLETIERCVEAGADTFVAGSAVFNAEEPDEMIIALRSMANQCGHRHG